MTPRECRWFAGLGHLLVRRHGHIRLRFGNQGHHALRDIGHELDRRAIPGRQIVPAPVDCGGKGEGDDQDGAAGKPAFGQRRGKEQLGRPLETRGLGLEALHHFLAVKTDLLGKGAHEADRIDGPRQLVETAVLNRLQIDPPDSELGGDLAEVQPGALAGFLQQRGNVPPLGRRDAGLVSRQREALPIRLRHQSRPPPGNLASRYGKPSDCTGAWGKR